MQEAGLVEGSVAPSGEGDGAAGGKKKKGGSGVTPTEQTWPVPTVPIMDLYPKGNFPLGECCDYQGLNAYRSTKAELKEQEKVHIEEYQHLREAAEVHRTARKYLQSIAKPGEKMIDLCESLENKVWKLSFHTPSSPRLPSTPLHSTPLSCPLLSFHFPTPHPIYIQRTLKARSQKP